MDDFCVLGHWDVKIKYSYAFLDCFSHVRTYFLSSFTIFLHYLCCSFLLFNYLFLVAIMLSQSQSR